MLAQAKGPKIKAVTMTNAKNLFNPFISVRLLRENKFNPRSETKKFNPHLSRAYPKHNVFVKQIILPKRASSHKKYDHNDIHSGLFWC
jgi:hypothetical protein